MSSLVIFKSGGLSARARPDPAFAGLRPRKRGEAHPELSRHNLQRGR